MEMPGSAPGVWKQRWQYCPMRTRRLCELTLAVLAAHALVWQLAVDGPPAPAPARAGARRIALVSAAPPTQAAAASSDAAIGAGQAAPAARMRTAPAARAPKGEGGALRRGPRDARAWPVYPTLAPPSITLRYALMQTGAATAAGAADLEWRRDASGFSLGLVARLAGRPLREWQSTGSFDAAGVAPSRLVEREKGRDVRAVTFDRDGGVARLSSAPGRPVVAPGAQDRWSWIAQLAAIVEAAARRGERPAHWDLQVAGLRGQLERWTFRVLPLGDPPPELLQQGNELSARPDRAPALLHVLRATEQPYDLRIEAWLSPSLHHLPAGLRMSTPPGPWSLSLWQRNP
ncbi:MAG: hypothetical protein JF585_03780 [Burkholderiales bacterium]|nr:hypothetical protein [Burkholderiales bacterium]